MKKQKTIWLQVTNDEYEIPICTADTLKEFSKIVGVSPSAIIHRIEYAEKSGVSCEFKRVCLEEGV